ncbi:hypothetical protein CK220_25950 [Mesorhizobium sp. WSM3860]|nr:hypothetical protein CK220_25950 [Mesorhizobium sp. WSM3860]
MSRHESDRDASVSICQFDQIDTNHLVNVVTTLDGYSAEISEAIIFYFIICQLGQISKANVDDGSGVVISRIKILIMFEIGPLGFRKAARIALTLVDRPLTIGGEQADEPCVFDCVLPIQFVVLVVGAETFRQTDVESLALLHHRLELGAKHKGVEFIGGLSNSGALTIKLPKLFRIVFGGPT